MVTHEVLVEQQRECVEERLEALDVRTLGDRVRDESYPEGRDRLVVLGRCTMSLRIASDRPADDLDRLLGVANGKPSETQVITMAELAARKRGEELVHQALVGVHRSRVAPQLRQERRPLTLVYTSGDRPGEPRRRL